ncbi:hypothetical protein HYPSUDRAFT_1008374 [Hypholoma sublateritium FD-334 SS-4]|uniref:Uncharacterized protein n=1 Tax=Hypholoma sublateritium (strain FD-334 SS-4) TaxID=945553 RepID=A0A0D2NLW9_HYPSF|nr:hypothetical protein HYPSUDRAFT_1008374 [Hypholoma sublateritium FD-334 SS-4]
MVPFRHMVPATAPARTEDMWAIYIHVGALSVMMWNLITRSGDDYRLLISHNTCLKTAIYFISRTTTFLFAFTKVIYLTAPINDCNFMHGALSIIFTIAICSTLLLMSTRLHTLLHKTRTALIILTLIFLPATAGALAFLVGALKDISTTSLSKACTSHIVGKYEAVALCLVLVYHVAMLGGVIVGICENVAADRANLAGHERYQRTVDGRSLYLENPLTVVDRVFYIFATGLSTASLVWFFAAQHAPASFRLAPVAVYLICTHIVIGGVFRDAKLKQHCQCPPSTTTIAPCFKVDMPSIEDNSNAQDGSSDWYASGGGEVERTDTKGLDIEISQVVEFKRDARVAFAPEALLGWKAPRLSAFRDDVFSSPK